MIRKEAKSYRVLSEGAPEYGVLGTLERNAELGIMFRCSQNPVMRKLVFSFRAILRVGRLRRWPPSIAGRGEQERCPFIGTLCADFQTGPKRGGEQTVEQRAGGGTT
jgi:hypothetical protein